MNMKKLLDNELKLEFFFMIKKILTKKYERNEKIYEYEDENLYLSFLARKKTEQLGSLINNLEEIIQETELLTIDQMTDEIKQFKNMRLYK